VTRLVSINPGRGEKRAGIFRTAILDGASRIQNEPQGLWEEKKKTAARVTTFPRAMGDLKKGGESREPYNSRGNKGCFEGEKTGFHVVGNVDRRTIVNEGWGFPRKARSAPAKKSGRGGAPAQKKGREP